MNIIEMAREAGIHVYPEFEKAFERFAELVRADEREALEKIDWAALMREGSLVTRCDAQKLGDRILAAIRARGTT